MQHPLDAFRVAGERDIGLFVIRVAADAAADDRGRVGAKRVGDVRRWRGRTVVAAQGDDRPAREPLVEADLVCVEIRPVDFTVSSVVLGT
jgi:hypothetical protein